MAVSGETSLIIIANIIGINLALCSNNLIITLISWELINITIYNLISLNNQSDRVLANSIKYFIISAFSTTMMILGITLIYMETGSFNYSIVHLWSFMDGQSYIFELGRFFIITTIILKLAGAPLHSWAPDLYDSQPTYITQYLLIVPKLGNFLLLSNLYYMLTCYAYSFEPLFIMGCISILIGSLSLLSQVHVKRFLAFSSICHVGFLLIALYFGGYTAYIQYIAIYALTSINLFIVLLLFNSPRNLGFIALSHAGLPLFIAFSINLFSLAGLPPLAGFFAKLGLFGTILNQYSIGIPIILLFILGSVVSSYNYFRLISNQTNAQLIPLNFHSPIILPTSLYDILAILSTILFIYPFIGL